MGYIMLENCFSLIDSLLPINFFNKGELLLIIEAKIKAIDDPILFQKTYLDIKIPLKLLEDLSNKHYIQIKKEFDQRQKNTINPSNNVRDSAILKKSNTIEEKCDPTSPICVKTLEKNKLRKKKQSFFIYRQGFSPHIIADYIDQCGKPVTQKLSNDNILDNSNEDEETLKLMQKPENNVIIGRVHHICFKKQMASRQQRTKDETYMKFMTDTNNLSHDEKGMHSQSKEETSKNLRSSSLNKSKPEKKPKPKIKKFSEKVTKSKDFFVNLFKGSFCMNQQKDMSFSINVEIKPRVLDFDSFLSRSKQIPASQSGKTHSFNANGKKEYDSMMSKELYKEEIKDHFYENGLGLTPLSEMIDVHLYEKYRDKLERSNSIIFNKNFLGEHKEYE